MSIREINFPPAIDTEPVTKHIPAFMDSLYNTASFNLIKKEEIRDAFHTNQVLSKAWLIEKFIDAQVSKSYKILMIGSWIGFVTYCINSLGYEKIEEIDSDPRMTAISMYLNHRLQNYHHCIDVNDFVDIEEYDVIINTSCEHIKDDSWFKRIKKNALVFLQSNNFKIPEHVNICSSVDEMRIKYALNLRFSGVLKLKIYDRYMLVGYKY